MRGRVGSSIARQTLSASTALANALSPSILNLAAMSGVFESSDLARPALCESCAQKLTVSGVLTATMPLSSVLSRGDYFVVADSPTTSTTTSTLRCVMKVANIVDGASSSTIDVDANDPGRGACLLPATYEAKAWRISSLSSERTRSTTWYQDESTPCGSSLAAALWEKAPHLPQPPRSPQHRR